MSGCYDECPECGCTNYKSEHVGNNRLPSIDQEMPVFWRMFECGFCCDDHDRTALCEYGREELPTDFQQPLLHFAHALDAITEDLQKDGGPVDYIVKYKMLARDALSLAGGDKKTAITHDKTWKDWMKNWSK